MFLPIGDTPNPRGFVPWVTWLLIAVNVAIHLLLALPASMMPADPSSPGAVAIADRLRDLGPGVVQAISGWDVFVEDHGFRPGAPSALDLFTAMFLHANLAHLVGNMLFLWIYGDNVEHRVGRLPFLAGYLATGAAATLAFAAIAADPLIPMIGASGAISGVLGAYFVMFPRNRVKLFVFLFPFVLDVWLVPAPLVLGIYVVIDNLLPLFFGAGSGVAYGAHLGGFVAGLALAWAANRALRPTGLTAETERAGPTDRAAAHLDAADQLAARSQWSAAYQHYLRALELSADPAIVDRARDGLRRLPLDPRHAARLGL
ncbi:MAG: rhomboid family intramembrane serine protease [Myxococcota bacterium]